MNKPVLFLSSSFGLTFAIVVSSLVIIALAVIAFVMWWIDVKKKTIKQLGSSIKNSTCGVFGKIGGKFVSQKAVKTVYSDKSMNYSGTEFLPIPTKAPTNQYTFEFVGWDKNAVDVKGNFVVRAIYLQKVRVCYVNVYDDDRVTLLKSLEVEYGASADISDLQPSKPDTNEFSYEFVGWDKDITQIYQNESIYAVYKAISKKFSYTFFDVDEKTVLCKGYALYGTPIICPPEPKCPGADDSVYDFVGWKNYSEGMTLTENIEFTPIFVAKKVVKDDNSSVVREDANMVTDENKNKFNTITFNKPKFSPKSFELERDEIIKGGAKRKLPKIVAKSKVSANETIENDVPKIEGKSDEERVNEIIEVLSNKTTKDIHSNNDSEKLILENNANENKSIEKNVNEKVSKSKNLQKKESKIKPTVIKIEIKEIPTNVVSDKKKSV